MTNKGKNANTEARRRPGRCFAFVLLHSSFFRHSSFVIRHSVQALLILFSSLNLIAADASYYAVVKAGQYQQTNDSAPSLLSSNAFAFTAFVVPSTNFAVTNATVKPSNSTPLRTLTLGTNGDRLTFVDSFGSQAAMDAVYPTSSGFNPVTYTMTMYGVNDGARSGGLTFYLLIFALSYPTVPQLTNLATAQAIDTTRDFTLNWNSLGGSSVTIVQLTILDASSNLVFATSAPFQPGALNGASTSATIPAYALPAAASLTGHLTIANPGNPNTNSYPGAFGAAALANDTQFPLITRPAPPRPQLHVLPRSAGQFQLGLTGETNRLYQVQASSDLLAWTNLFTTNCLTGIFTYTDADSSNRFLRFYRGKVGQ